MKYSLSEQKECLVEIFCVFPELLLMFLSLSLHDAQLGRWGLLHPTDSCMCTVLLLFLFKIPELFYTFSSLAVVLKITIGG